MYCARVTPAFAFACFALFCPQPAAAGTVPNGGALFPTVTFETHESNLLALEIEFETAGPTRPSVTVQSEAGVIEVPPGAIESTEGDTLHLATVMGMRASSLHDIQISASVELTTPEPPAGRGDDPDLIFANDFESGQLQSWTSAQGGVDFSYTTPALVNPPPFEVLVDDRAEREPGYTIIPMHRSVIGDLANIDAKIYALDEDGEIVWVHDPIGAPIDALQPMPDGNIIFLVASVFHELDPYGREISNYSPEQMGVIRIHHDIELLPNGNLLTLGKVAREAPFPDICGPNQNQIVTYQVVFDTIVELKRNGEVVSEVPLSTEFSPYRIPDNALDAFCLKVNDDFFGFDTKDSTHGNAIVYDPADDTVIVSLRNQNVIAKVNRYNGQLIWVIGEDIPSASDDAWPFLTPSGPVEFPNQPAQPPAARRRLGADLRQRQHRSHRRRPQPSPRATAGPRRDGGGPELGLGRSGLRPADLRDPDGLRLPDSLGHGARGRHGHHRAEAPAAPLGALRRGPAQRSGEGLGAHRPGARGIPGGLEWLQRLPGALALPRSRSLMRLPSSRAQATWM